MSCSRQTHKWHKKQKIIRFQRLVRWHSDGKTSRQSCLETLCNTQLVVQNPCMSSSHAVMPQVSWKSLRRYFDTYHAIANLLQNDCVPTLSQSADPGACEREPACESLKVFVGPSACQIMDITSNQLIDSSALNSHQLIDSSTLNSPYIAL